MDDEECQADGEGVSEEVSSAKHGEEILRQPVKQFRHGW